MSKTIGIVGLGLIGGSLGLDLRSRGFQVYGVSRQARTCQIAVERGIADEAGLSLELLALADIIFICTPIAAIAPTLKQLIPYLSLNTIVTDVGSVKTPIVQECSQLWDYLSAVIRWRERQNKALKQHKKIYLSMLLMF